MGHYSSFDVLTLHHVRDLEAPIIISISYLRTLFDVLLVRIFARNSSHSLRPNKSSKLSLRGLLLSIADLITSDNSIEFWILSATVRIRPQATHFQFLPTFTCSKWPHLVSRLDLGDDVPIPPGSKFRMLVEI